MNRCAHLILAICALVLINPYARASSPGPSEQDRYAAFLQRNTRIGPAPIMLRGQAKLDLPAHYAFLPEAAAKKFMQALGNNTDANFLGIILPDTQSNWFSFLEFDSSGYVKDDEGQHLDPDAMLQQIRENTEEENKVRKARGISELEILGWIEKPHYDRATHRLIWSISARDRGNTKDRIINYKTLLLGRQGYIAMVMVTDLKTITAQKPIASLLLSKLSFVNGKQYSDFNASTDHVAEYGIAALIGGVVAHKLGFFALAAAFLAKSAKVLILAVIGGFAAFRRWFRRKKPAPAEALDSAPAVAGEASAAAPLPVPPQS